VGTERRPNVVELAGPSALAHAPDPASTVIVKERHCMSLTISVFSDVVCPWCLIGKRRLERALDQLGIRDSTTVEWLPFELNPNMQPEGMERARYRAQKFGADRAAILDAHLQELGAAEGIMFAFDRIQRTPNTRRAHMLIAYAGRQGKANAIVEALFRAYFEHGQDVGHEDVLVGLAASVGLSERLRELVVEVERRASELQIAGVPYFIVDGTWAVSGAQTTEQWVAALKDRYSPDPQSKHAS
jgi:predicted DsbA family dithiol-disulfide isomerase